MKRILFRCLLLLILLIALSVIAHHRTVPFYSLLLQEKASREKAKEDEHAPLAPVEPPKPYFFPGEEIVYSVVLGKVSLGQAKFNHREMTQLDGKEVHQITFDTKLIRFRDSEKILFDPRSLLPLKIQREVAMFPFPEKITEEYDQKNFTLTVSKTKLKRNTTLVIKKDRPIQNAILLPYLVRTIPLLSQGWTQTVTLPTQEFTITLTGIEEVKVPAGTFSAFHFQSTPRKFEIWISNDDQRVPLKIKGMGTLGYSLLMKERNVP